MIIRLFIAATGISLGLACIFATDQVWLLVHRVNQAFGREVTRTKQWEARAPLAGIALVGSGVLFVVTTLIRT